MRAWIAVALAAVALAGCVNDDDEARTPGAFPLEMYRFHYEGSDTFVEGVDHGWMIRIHNPSDVRQTVSLIPNGVASGVIGPIDQTGGTTPQTAWLPGRIEENQFGTPLVLDAGESGLFVARIEAYDEPNASSIPVSVRAIALETDAFQPPATSELLAWTVMRAGAGTPVVPGDHVETVTIGVWLNGTSFYSNAAGALSDPAFPHGAGWTTANDATDPLPIYVFNADRDEQPAGSQDTCHFTTISGYNALLKTQSEGSTNVALLRPESAYTSEGAEAHPLYGDSLVFMNTIVAHAGATGTEDEVPDPTGACFGDRITDLQNTVLGVPPTR